MLGKSYIKEAAMKSALASQSRIKPKSGKGKKPLVFSLMLTSMIDAFAILVVFLLSNANNSGQQLDLQGKIQLPATAYTEALGTGSTVIKVVDNYYFVNEKRISPQDLTAALYILEKKDDLIVQADRKLEYNVLSPIILAASHAGFEKFKFVVIPSAERKVAVK